MNVHSPYDSDTSNNIVSFLKRISLDEWLELNGNPTDRKQIRALTHCYRTKYKAYRILYTIYLLILVAVGQIRFAYRKVFKPSWWIYTCANCGKPTGAKHFGYEEDMPPYCARRACFRAGSVHLDRILRARE